MDFLKTWVYTIVVTLIFVAFIDILMPSSSMKKYVKLVLGLLIMAVILKPVMSLRDADFNLSADIFSYQGKLDQSSLKKQAEYYSKGQEAEIIKVYKQNLESRMEQQIRLETESQDAKVSIDVDEDKDSERYGEIKKVSISIEKQVNQITKVDKIRIGESSNESQKEEEKYESNYSELLEKISSMYGIDKDKIEIKLLTKGGENDGQFK